MASEAHTARAIIASAPGEGHVPGTNWKMSEVKLKPLKDDEVLVQMVATGICHSDLVLTSMSAEVGKMMNLTYPKIVGHEGAGYVKAIGPKVTKKLEVGDPVLLSFDSCRSCTSCRTGHPAYCSTFNPINMGGSHTFESTSGEDIGGQFFGHSSFASLSNVTEGSIINVKGLVKDDEELKLLAPLGCGFQTGCGTVVNLTKATNEDQVVVMGLGGVGLSAIMGAAMIGCKKIIGVDRFTNRLELAKSFGATDVVDTSPADMDIVAEIKKLTGGEGASIVIDTTGVPKLLQAGLAFLANRGKMVLIGATPADFFLPVHVATHLVTGKQLIGGVEGDVVPEKFVPQMINWYHEGKFPVDKLVKHFKADDFEKALHEMHTGETIKPIILW